MKFSREIKTGVIVIGGILLFILGFSYLKSSPLFDNSRTFFVVYDHVGGLQPGTQVSINGYTVGKVNGIKFKDASGRLLVTFSVDKAFDFSQNSLAELYDTGIIGGKGIQIQPVFDNAPNAKDGDTLKASIRPGLTELVQDKLTPLQLKVEEAITNADSLLFNVNQVLDANTRIELRSSISGLNELVQHLAAASAKINGLMDRNQQQIDSMVFNFNHITENFSGLSDSLNSVGFGQMAKSLEKTLENLNSITSTLEKGNGSLGKLIQDPGLYQQLEASSRQLNLLLQDFRLNPKRYVNVSVFGKKQKEYTLPETDPAAAQDSLQ
ncbi:MAG: hypothetical protein RLZZ241_915 [Bacteroidota bacterium]